MIYVKLKYEDHGRWNWSVAKGWWLFRETIAEGWLCSLDQAVEDIAMAMKIASRR